MDGRTAAIVQQLFDDETCSAAESDLVARGAAAVPVIARLFTSQGREHKTRLAVVLGKIGDGQAIPVLAEALANRTDFRVHTAALRALRRIGDIESLDVVSDFETDDSQEVARVGRHALMMLCCSRSA